MTIEEAIRRHAADQRLSMTLVQVSSGKYQASLQNGRNIFRVQIDADPVVALMRVLDLEPESEEGIFG